MNFQGTTTEKKIYKKKEKEKEVVKNMIEIYCRGNKHDKEKTCSECQELIEYSHDRLDKCPFMEEKTFCSNCEKHCYKKEEREKIRRVMRYSGPRILFYHPIMAIKHLIYSLFSYCLSNIK